MFAGMFRSNALVRRHAHAKLIKIDNIHDYIFSLCAYYTSCWCALSHKVRCDSQQKRRNNSYNRNDDADGICFADNLNGRATYLPKMYGSLPWPMATWKIFRQMRDKCLSLSPAKRSRMHGTKAANLNAERMGFSLIPSAVILCGRLYGRLRLMAFGFSGRFFVASVDAHLSSIGLQMTAAVLIFAPFLKCCSSKH